MTDKEKAWAYDGALKRAETAIDFAADKDLVKGIVNTIFPLLREGQENNVIDIPFGAHDSELKGWEYTIPEGFTAEIRGGKVIVREKESEDERIRKSLVDYFGRYNPKDKWDEEFSFKDVLAYFERQKEQKSIEDVVKDITKNKEDAIKFLKSAGIMDDNGELAEMYRSEEQKSTSYSPLCNTIKDKIREYVANHFVTDAVVKTDVRSIVKAMEEGVRLGKEEQKKQTPAEWSEKDIAHII